MLEYSAVDMASQNDKNVEDLGITLVDKDRI